jgi:hypothetical protein
MAKVAAHLRPLILSQRWNARCRASTTALLKSPIDEGKGNPIRFWALKLKRGM